MDVVGILGTSGEHFHYNHVFRTGHPDTDALDVSQLSALQKEILETCTREDHVDRYSGGRMHQGDDSCAGDERLRVGDAQRESHVLQRCDELARGVSSGIDGDIDVRRQARDAASSSTTREGMRGAIEEARESDMMLEILGAILFGGPVRSHLVRMLPQRLTGPPSGLGTLFPESPCPVALL